MNEISMLINGKKCQASNGKTFTRNNPLDQKIATAAPAGTLDDATAAVNAAAGAFDAWSQTGPTVRRNLLLKAAESLEALMDDFVIAMGKETGASELWARFNVATAAGMLREAASLTSQIGGDVIPSDVSGNLAMALRVPAGVVVGIAPWNAPVILGVRALATPLACGNTVVLKGSEMCPATHALIIEAINNADFPAGVVNFITNAPTDAGPVVEALVAHPATRRVNFTGSTRVGRIIAELCARYLKPVVLELGGKAPLVVLDDADLQTAVNAAAFSAFVNSGQVCMSAERIVVDEHIADRFISKLKQKTEQLPLGDPREAPVVLGSVVDLTAVQRANEMIKDAIDKGATLVCGGSADSTLMPATLLDHVTPEMRIYKEEVFAPVRAIIRVKDEEEAVDVANDTQYGLSAAVISKDIARALRVARRIKSGICHINSGTVHDEPQMPFGGVKESGYGRFGGRAGVESFTDVRWITLQITDRPYPF